MKEKIIKILESQFSVVEYEDPDTGFTESTTIDVLTTDEFPDIVDKHEHLVNQEVEKRIAERMPSEEEINHEAADRFADKKTGHVKPHLWATFRSGAKWYRSRLTNQKQEDNNGSAN